MKGKARHKKVFGLKELLQHSRECRASDPRDKIYAFLGLADQGYSIIPKYTWENTIVHVLIHTAHRIITFEGNLDILEHVSEGREKLGTLLPSWVPDKANVVILKWTSNDSKMFSQKFHRLVNATRLRDGNKKPFQASKEEIGAPGFVRDEFNDSNLDLKTFLTPSGLRVHTSQVAAYDDEVWVLYGARKPVILRLEQGKRYSFLSEALVCGYDSLISDIMFGSMVDMVRNNEAKVQEITIV
ncbi:hypothetical protein NA56DRAFT_698183 [Hyaloscypha hepaticicola]|uniref:Uncharacterized protein n=1 Tax=Hyaloscypha hepaticicola TaxID=2082293 RepID=A0A2J6QKY9_9HELO|nr:hypothetical protein NA56DRAFT_698183 [Hyaloscypha hepaticicola]